ncbi:MAG: HD family phosphohydrolase [Flavobacteriaceae bacterium]
MKELISRLYKNHSNIYKGILFLISVVLVVYFFPKGGQFKYEFQKGKPWQYDNLYAPFDFAIQKSKESIDREKQEIESEAKIYLYRDLEVEFSVKTELENILLTSVDSLGLSATDSLSVAKFINRIKQGVSREYNFGYYDASVRQKIKDTTDVVVVRNGNNLESKRFFELKDDRKILLDINGDFGPSSPNPSRFIENTLLNVIRPSVFYDADLTDKVLKEDLSTIAYTQGKVSKDELIILRGDIVEGRVLDELSSLKLEYESQVWSQQNYLYIVLGYTFLVCIVFAMMLFFMHQYRPDVYQNNTKVTFIFFNVVSMILLTTVVVKYNAQYVYAVPLCILPIVLKAFFDARLGLFVHVLTVLLLGFIVPNSFEYTYLQIIAGIVTILNVGEFHKRTNLFATIGAIIGVYMVTYSAFDLIQEGGIDKLNPSYFGLFILNGLGMVLSLFLIYIYEKTFNLVSDVTLLELSNTNSPLLRELNEKAPGTFQHSMQVANLAEAAANAISANSMLVRTGALYHDIGKIKNPFYFIENQVTGVNPHDEISPKESGKIIIDHVSEGIKLAKKTGLPDRIIDFIRTHHGNSVVYYFYRKEMDQADEDDPVNISDFTYPGPIPFSKETAILMMADSVEAASKSLERPNAQMIDTLVENIVNKQLNEGQFQNADITLKEITAIKEVLKKKLLNIYHLRVEYPD